MGIELEDIELETMMQGYSIVRQIILCLSNAEHLCEFEHRDLHLSNILISEAGAFKDDSLINTNTKHSHKGSKKRNNFCSL